MHCPQGRLRLGEVRQEVNDSEQGGRPEEGVRLEARSGIVRAQTQGDALKT